MTTPYTTSIPGIVPTSTIMPTNKDLFTPYFTRTYEELAQAINNKDNIYFQVAITSTATNIPDLPTFGSFIVSVSGVMPTLPTVTVCLSKADPTASGAISLLGFQAGTGAWAGFTITISSTSTNFQIAHNNTGVTGNFNIRILGTQGAS